MRGDFEKQDALFWGQFILAAERMYERGKRDPKGTAKLPDNWRIIQTISMQARLDFLHNEEFIGFVAESTGETQQRSIIFHGSQTFFDWVDDFEFALEGFPYLGKGVKTEYGFTQLYESLSFTDLETGRVQTLAQSLQSLQTAVPYTIAGHSLGGALAALYAAVAAEHKAEVTAYTFASPMVGNTEFTDAYRKLVTASYDIVNLPDMIPHLPGQLLGYDPTPNRVYINSLDVSEIRKCLRCYHSLETYLYTLGCGACELGGCRDKRIT